MQSEGTTCFAGVIDAFKGVYEQLGADRVVMEMGDVYYSGGNMAAERGTFAMYDKDDKVVMQGRYVFLCELQPRSTRIGHWLVVSLCKPGYT